MIGKVVGPYRVAAKLGEGGMGAVYRAVDQMLQRDVAIKVLRPELAKQATLVQRFRTEAVALARLNHPNIATVHGLLEQRDSLLMVMEFVDGDTLEEILLRDGRMPADYAVAVCRDVLAALHHAHGMGVTHRDLKPANLMIARNGVVKVMDFGIARMAGTSRHTEFGRVIGTPLYMSPEQLRGEDVDGRSDVYSLGIVLYELLTGCEAFRADSDYAILMAQLSQMPEPPSRLVRSLPEGLDDVLMRSLQKPRADRYQSAAEFREALTPFALAAARPSLGGVPRIVTPPLPAPPPEAQAPPTEAEAPQPSVTADPLTAESPVAPTAPATPPPQTRLADPVPAPETRLADSGAAPATRLADVDQAPPTRFADPAPAGYSPPGPTRVAGEPQVAAAASANLWGRARAALRQPAARRYGLVAAVLAAVVIGRVALAGPEITVPPSDSVGVRDSVPPSRDSASPVTPPPPFTPVATATNANVPAPERVTEPVRVDPSPRPAPPPPPPVSPRPSPPPAPAPPPPAPQPPPALPDPAEPAEDDVAVTPAMFAGGLEPVTEMLKRRRVAELERLYQKGSGQDSQNWAALARLLERFSAELQDLSVSSASGSGADRASVQYAGQLRWRSSFGNTRREDIRIAATFERQGGAWRLRAWRFIGAPDLD